jgi:hypothetical protein
MNCDVLEGILATNLESVYDFTITNNTALNSFNMSGLEEVVNNFTVTNNVALLQTSVDALITQINAADGIGGTTTTSGNLL